jgi:hypothetical protein
MFSSSPFYAASCSVSQQSVSESLLEQIISFSNHLEMSETAGDSLRYNGFKKSQKGTKKLCCTRCRSGRDHSVSADTDAIDHLGSLSLISQVTCPVSDKCCTIRCAVCSLKTRLVCCRGKWWSFGVCLWIQNHKIALCYTPRTKAWYCLN